MGSNLLQKGPKPRVVEDAFADPNLALDPSEYRRASCGGSAGVMPSEAYQYDLVYNEFCKDEAFWKNWKVVNCARCSPEESLSSKNAAIKVVMDLPSSQRLFPTAYTPGLHTLPMSAGSTRSGEQGTTIPGLPEGYSVALDVHLLENAKIVLAHQRAFRGEVEHKFEWLDRIISGRDTSAIAPADALGDTAKPWAPPERGPNCSLPYDCFPACERGMGEEELKDPRAVEIRNKRRELHNENAIVNVFGGTMSIPPRSDGTWNDAGPKISEAQQIRDRQEAVQLDRQLQDLLARTSPDSASTSLPAV